MSPAVSPLATAMRGGSDALLSTIAATALIAAPRCWLAKAAAYVTFVGLIPG